jgi:hypothetical protein
MTDDDEISPDHEACDAPQTPTPGWCRSCVTSPRERQVIPPRCGYRSIMMRIVVRKCCIHVRSRLRATCGDPRGVEKRALHRVAQAPVAPV